jgi:hypothetical protein
MKSCQSPLVARKLENSLTRGEFCLYILFAEACYSHAMLLNLTA